jgi:uncharacterized membrane protein YfhO
VGWKSVRVGLRRDGVVLVRLSIKIAVLSAILAADLSFFLFFKTHFPQAYELIFQKMPWPDDFEKTFAIIIGLVTALLTSFSMVHIMVKHLLKSIQRG